MPLTIEERIGLANRFRDNFRGVEGIVNTLKNELVDLEVLADRIGSNEGFPAQQALEPDDESSFEDLATAWLDRQRILGLISDEGVRTVEKLIAEVG